jgi:hypothetical protein
MMILPIVSLILMRVNQEPWFIVSYSANLITDVLGVSGGVPTGPGEHFPGQNFTPDFGVGIAVMIAYAIVGLVSGMVIAGRKED